MAIVYGANSCGLYCNLGLTPLPGLNDLHANANAQVKNNLYLQTRTLMNTIIVYLTTNETTIRIIVYDNYPSLFKKIYLYSLYIRFHRKQWNSNILCGKYLMRI